MSLNINYVYFTRKPVQKTKIELLDEFNKYVYFAYIHVFVQSSMHDLCVHVDYIGHVSMYMYVAYVCT